MSATLFDVCRQAGVSTATVSRVLNNSPLVTEETRQRVEEAIRDLDYRPSHAARMLARRKTDALGVIFPELDSGFFTEVLRGIDEEAASANYHLITAFSRGILDEEDLINRFIQERRVDGIILMNLVLPDTYVRNLSSHNMPCVLIDRPVSGGRFSVVSMDNECGAREATHHLVKDHRYRRIAWLTGPANTYDARRRMEGCMAALAEEGLEADPDLVWPGTFREESGYQAMETWLRKGAPLPEAVFALNDPMAFGVIESLNQHGIAIPQQVAVMGFDDVPAARLLGLTTVAVPAREMGRSAARLAVGQVRDQAEPSGDILPTRLVVRRTCGCSLPHRSVPAAMEQKDAGGTRQRSPCPKQAERSSRGGTT